MSTVNGRCLIIHIICCNFLCSTVRWLILLATAVNSCRRLGPRSTDFAFPSGLATLDEFLLLQPDKSASSRRIPLQGARFFAALGQHCGFEGIQSAPSELTKYFFRAEVGKKLPKQFLVPFRSVNRASVVWHFHTPQRHLIQ